MGIIQFPSKKEREEMLQVFEWYNSVAESDYFSAVDRSFEHANMDLLNIALKVLIGVEMDDVSVLATAMSELCCLDTKSNSAESICFAELKRIIKYYFGFIDNLDYEDEVGYGQIAYYMVMRAKKSVLNKMLDIFDNGAYLANIAYTQAQLALLTHDYKMLDALCSSKYEGYEDRFLFLTALSGIEKFKCNNDLSLLSSNLQIFSKLHNSENEAIRIASYYYSNALEGCEIAETPYMKDANVLNAIAFYIENSNETDRFKFDFAEEVLQFCNYCNRDLLVVYQQLYAASAKKNLVDTMLLFLSGCNDVLSFQGLRLAKIIWSDKSETSPYLSYLEGARSVISESKVRSDKRGVPHWCELENGLMNYKKTIEFSLPFAVMFGVLQSTTERERVRTLQLLCADSNRLDKLYCDIRFSIHDRTFMMSVASLTDKRIRYISADWKDETISCSAPKNIENKTLKAVYNAFKPIFKTYANTNSEATVAKSILSEYEKRATIPDDNVSIITAAGALAEVCIKRLHNCAKELYNINGDTHDRLLSEFTAVKNDLDSAKNKNRREKLKPKEYSN